MDEPWEVQPSGFLGNPGKEERIAASGTERVEKLLKRLRIWERLRGVPVLVPLIRSQGPSRSQHRQKQWSKIQ